MPAKPRQRTAPSPAPLAPPPAPSRWRALAEPKIAYPLASLLLLIPCFWQSRIQAGDLSSHVYNAWLAQLISQGQAPGLYLARQTTNVLFDLMLDGLFNLVGPAAAQRIAVSVCVLVFSWGAFAFASVLAARRVWRLLPMIAIFAYGWVFHMGFFDFYLSLGLCFFALACFWNGLSRRSAPVLLLLPLAWLAHALPVVWTLAVLGYVWIVGRVTPRRQFHVVIAILAALAVARVVLGSWTQVVWYKSQLVSATGVDQLSVYDIKYEALAVGLFLVWGFALAILYRDGGFREMGSGIPYQVWLLTVAGICILPSNLVVPGYPHALAYIAERMSLPVAICLCGLVGRARFVPPLQYALAALAIAFFACQYRDEGVLNSVEDRMERLVAQVPSGQRMLSAIKAANLRANPMTHMIDRVCIGRCYSYGNYEPSAGAFRVRAGAVNPIVTASYVDAWRMELGTYVLKESELPVYELNLDRNQRLVMLSLLPGVPVGITEWSPL